MKNYDPKIANDWEEWLLFGGEMPSILTKQPEVPKVKL